MASQGTVVTFCQSSGLCTLRLILGNDSNWNICCRNRWLWAFPVLFDIDSQDICGWDEAQAITYFLLWRNPEPGATKCLHQGQELGRWGTLPTTHVQCPFYYLTNTLNVYQLFDFFPSSNPSSLWSVCCCLSAQTLPTNCHPDFHWCPLPSQWRTCFHWHQLPLPSSQSQTKHLILIVTYSSLFKCSPPHVSPSPHTARLNLESALASVLFPPLTCQSHW